jgi:hypothetical protein
VVAGPFVTQSDLLQLPVPNGPALVESQMKNQVKVRTVVVIAFIYLWGFAFAIGLGAPAVVLLAVYCIASIAGAKAMLAADLAMTTREAETFRKVHPMRGLGSMLTDFQHVYYNAEDLLPEILNEFNTRIVQQGFGATLQKKNYTDTDKNLEAPETREFFVASSGASLRGTETSLVVHVRRHGQAQSVQWWILMRGFVDRNKRIILLASAPLAIPFWIWARLKQELDLVSSVRNVYGSFYNSLDVAAEARSWHRLVFDALADSLEKHGVDISDLKLQRAQVMNINISGGRTRFGNVVQAVRQANVMQTGAGR